MATIKSYNKRLVSLESERSSYMSHYRDLSDYHLAYRGRFLVTDRNDGNKRNTRQYNNHSKLAARTLASGMMAGITSPARPWFKLGAPDPELNEYAAVKEWLHDVQTTMYQVYSASNAYNALHSLYSELGVFATGAMGVYEDFENVIWCQPYTVGSYMIAANGRNHIDTFYREYETTIGECVKQFGLDNCSTEVQGRWRNGSTESAITIVQIVEPNDDRDNNSPMARDKKFRAVYYEKSSSSSATEDKFLRRSGHDEFPIMVPRWDIVGEDVYGTDSPGMTALGDSKALQLAERRKYQGIDKLVNPPLIGNVSLKSKLSGSPQGGSIIWSDDKNSDGIKSVYDNYNPHIEVINSVIQENEHRISRAFYEDLFLMMANSDRRQITAREIAEKQEEKLLMLGPVLERLHNELLDPMIDRTFNILQRSGVLPPPPPELQDTEIKVEYVSVLAQAQRMVAVTGIEQFTGFVSQVAAVYPGARHKLDPMQAIDDYAHAIGVNPKIVQSDDIANEINQAEQEAAQQQEAMAQASQAAEIAKTASEAGPGISEMMKQAGLQ